MDFIQRLCLYISLTSLVFLIIGLFKPWMMLWWEMFKTEKKLFCCMELFLWSPMESINCYFLFNKTMIKTLLATLATVICLSSCENKEKPKEDQSEKQVQPEPMKNDLPVMPVSLTDGSNIQMKEIKGRSVLILFQPDCEDCQHEAVEIQKTFPRLTHMNCILFLHIQWRSFKNLQPIIS